jgi:4-aminobutyrate aminotransferase/(S)-3-amino-2-methylpropionate transaminase
MDAKTMQTAKGALVQAYPIMFDAVFVKGVGVFLENDQGSKYVDFFAGFGVNNYGHCHPRLVAAITAQAKKLAHVGMIYYNEPCLQLAERLIGLLPRGLSRVYFANSGSEAVEAAVKLSKRYAITKGRTGSHVIALDFSFHGRGGVSLALTNEAKYKRNMGNFANYPGVYHVPTPYVYRSPLDEEGTRRWSLERLEETISYHIGQENVAAVIIEPLLGEGGIIVPPKGWLKEAEKIAHEHEILFILDEIQSGFGRTGKNFALEHENLDPDIVVIAKALGGGLPLGAMIAKESVSQVWQAGDHNSTFSANPIACAAGLAGIAVLTEERLAERAHDSGDFLMARLNDIRRNNPSLGDVRGQGLFVGVELVADETSKKPAKNFADKVRDLMFKEHVIVGTGGLFGNVVRFEPPLIAAEAHFETALKAFSNALRSLN